MDEGIDGESNIPKMIVQLHVENALKHGLLPKKSGGMLGIDISKAQDYILITITDNGIGRNLASKNMSQSTGKGMKILGQMFETYNKYNRNPLRQEIVDLFDNEGNPAGTQVKIYVPLDFNPEIY
jgi:sensor histidine kinase YesM